MNKTPILFIIFNRPDTAQVVFNAIRKHRPKYLYVAADGPREGDEQDKQSCQESRAIIDQIDWECEIKTLFRKKNLGCKLSVSSAITWFFKNVEAGIILEDDCVPHETFFRFAGEMLEKYEEEERIMMISGLNAISTYSSPTSYFFSRYFSVWGWATWRHTWQKYDIKMDMWPRTKTKGLDEYCADPYARKYLEESFDAAHAERINTWDIQWFFMCLVSNGLSVVPSTNLVSNIGMQGTHTGKNVGINQNLPTHNLYKQPFISPSSVEEDATYDSLFYKRNFHPKIKDLPRRIYQNSLKLIKKSNTLKRLCDGARITLLGHGLFESVNKTTYEKNCLLMYIVEPFRDQEINYKHQNSWQAKELARVIGEFGYNVDVIQFNDKRAKITKNYDLVIDLHPGINLLYTNNLNTRAKRVAYITGSNPSFLNSEEKKRIEGIYQRRGIHISPRRQTKPIDAKLLSSFDAMFFIGNEYNLKTYDDYTPKEVAFIKNTGYEFLAEHDHSQRSPKSFLFLASNGQALKGLDLLLEVFANNPNLDLYVCSNFIAEKDFIKLYKKELFETQNIHPVGFIDITSPAFAELTKKITFLIAPSCSEASASSVLTGMSAGLIPITSKECGFNDEDVHNLKDCSMKTIESAVREYSNKGKLELEKEAERVLEIIYNKRTNEHFSESVRLAISSLLSNKKEGA